MLEKGIIHKTVVLRSRRLMDKDNQLTLLSVPLWPLLAFII